MRTPRRRNLASIPASSTMRCAIYTRVSTDNGLDQDFNSLDAQREACEAYIKSQAHEGWKLVPDPFDDGGFSGASLDRPALTKLLDLVDRGRIDIIVVYKVDRLTRSLADFAKLVERFDARQVSFVSVTQSFNTTSSMGRLTLNMLLSFAQFEREVTGERIRDKIAASKKRGIWVGGTVPLGYRVIDRHLIVDEQEAETVRLVFDRYLACGSLFRLLIDLRERGVTTRTRPLATGKTIGGIPFTRGPLAYLLQNRVYLGEVNHHDKSYTGEHDAIVSRDVFDRVQALMAANGRKQEPSRPGSKALLKDLLFDDRGNRMTPSSAKKGGFRYRYYVSRALTEGAASQVGSLGRVSAPVIEDAVMKALSKLGAAQQPLGDEIASPSHQASGDQQGASSHSTDVRSSIERVILSRNRFTIVFSRDGKDHFDVERLDVDWSPRASKPQREILPPTNDPHHRMDFDTRKTLLTAIATSRIWIDELVKGATDIDAIAARGKRSSRGVQKILSLAFLSPRIVRAALDGSLPRGISMTRLFDLPMDWRKQHETLGIG